MLSRRLALGLPAFLGLAGLAREARALDTGDHVDTDGFLHMVTGVRYRDDKRGTGPEPRKGQKVTVNYTGWIFDDADRVGKKFDSSADHGSAFSFVLGTGQVIPGWDQGVSTMRVGGTRTMILPARLAYGERGAGGVIPANATLIFVVELLAVE
jgi:peptidylprolyl isomerase